MKSLTQYISEQMVCELSTPTIASAAKKAKGLRKGNFAEEALKRYTEELKKKGFKLADDACGDEDCPEYYWYKPNAYDVMFGGLFGDGTLEIWAYNNNPDENDDEDDEYFYAKNDNVKYTSKTHYKNFATAMVQFASVFGVKLDKNEILA